MTRTLALVIAVALLLLGACGDDDAEVTTPGVGAGDDPAVPVPPESHDDLPAPVCLGTTQGGRPEYRGLSVDAAEEFAVEHGLDIREVGRDGECFGGTDDFREDPLNIEIVGDTVVAAAVH